MAWLGAVVRSGLLVGVALRTARRRAAAVAELERVNRDLDERVRARTAELARSEARLGLALDAAAMAEWECDLATWTLAPSPRLSELFGYPSDRRLTIEDVRARYHPDDAERTRRMTAEALATGLRFAEYDYRIVLPDGAVRWLYTRGEVFRDADGRPVRAAGVVMDITGRKRTDEALQASEAAAQRRLAELQTIYDTSPVGLCFVDAGLRFVKINERMAEANGLPVAAHLGRTLREVKPALADHVEGHLRRVIETGEPIVDLELRQHGERPGADRYWLCSYHPVRGGADGRVLGVNAVVQEITERKRAEEARRRERELLQRIMDTIPVMIVLYEPDTRVLRLNPAFERLTGWTTEEARSVDLMAACYPDPDYREKVRAFMAEPQEGWMDIAMTTRDGRVAQTSWANIRFPDNTRIGIGIDITERKRAEDRQRLLLAELSHRVKNMLATVQSIALRSLSTGRPIEEARDAFMERLRALADTHSLLTAGDWHGASLRRLVEDVLAPYGRRAAIASEDLVLNPKAALTLGLVLHELATNAAKYGALAAPAGRVEVAWTIGDGAADDGDDGPRLRLLWRERGGPPVMPPERVGFGRTLIERAVAYDLDGTARLGFDPDGVVCELAAPLAEVAAGTT